MTNRADNAPLRILVTLPEVMDRFWATVDKDVGSGCWEYTGSKNAGYGRFYHKRRAYFAHRISYLLNCGRIPDDLVIDHMCRNRACCNPAHLRAVSLRVNVLENSESSAAIYAKRTHCGSGHEFSDSNLLPNNRGIRICRICERERKAKWKEESANAITPADRYEAEQILREGDVTRVARGASALRYMTYLSEHGLLPRSSNAHLKGPNLA